VQDVEHTGWLSNFAGTFALAAAAVAIGALALGADAHAQTYPIQPITLVIPFSAGGDADLAARSLSEVALRMSGLSLIPVNRAGASGAIGSMSVRNAKPDGYTLLLARVGSQVLLPALEPTVGYKWNDFTLIGVLELNPVVCVARADSSIRSMADLVQTLQARPGKLNYSTSGAGTILNFAPQLLFDVLNLGKDAAVQIAYKGGGEAALAVLSGDVDFSCGNLTSMIGNIKAAKLRALITTTPRRLKDLPDVQTAREAGYPQLEAIVGWSALYGPPGMSKELIDYWVTLLALAAKDEQWISATEKAASIAHVLSPSDTDKFVADQFAVYERLGRHLQIEFK
jgi:tripartite-type tricarboxylate transporter receptor subunit TctC